MGPRPGRGSGAKAARRQTGGKPARRAEWDRLSREIRACRKCPLGSLRSHAVVYRGGLAPRVVFVGEAPGAEEDRTGLPFVGRSGRLLDRAVATLGLSENEFGMLNVLKCRPPQNRFDRAAARACRPYLDRQLELLRPEVVVTLGARALAAFEPVALPMLAAAGHPRPGAEPAHFPLIHPAAALRSRRMHDRWETDLRALGEWLVERAA
ncbi:MAG TPA: uracil-DNA glycosylase [Thermoplasmata archaeon]|nr:uracil-DNA glycosylase [Thermoplasmata archaeon]